MRVAAPGDGTGPERVPTADVLHADGMALPYRSSAFDGVLCIAVLHHISSVPRRLHFLGELARLLRTGGRAIVSGKQRMLIFRNGSMVLTVTKPTCDGCITLLSVVLEFLVCP